jgi:hypothetical protein
LWSREQYENKEAERARRRQEAKKKPWYWLGLNDPVARSTAYLAVFTVGLILVSVAQWYVLHGQQVIMQGQLNAMEADQRPWIKIDVFPGALQVVLGPTDDNGPWLMFHPHFKMTNIGKSPAFNARSFVQGFIVGENHSDPLSEQKLMCEKIRSEKVDNDWAKGTVLFPGDYITEYMGGGASQAVGFVGKNALRYMKNINGKMSFSFYIVGCVDYAYGTELKRHQTGFVYEIYHLTDAGGLDSAFDASQSVPEEMIRIDLRWVTAD